MMKGKEEWRKGHENTELLSNETTTFPTIYRIWMKVPSFGIACFKHNNTHSQHNKQVSDIRYAWLSLFIFIKFKDTTFCLIFSHVLSIIHANITLIDILQYLRVEFELKITHLFRIKSWNNWLYRHCYCGVLGSFILCVN